MITEKQFDRIRTHLKARYGIDMNNKATIVDGRLENFVVHAGYKDYDEFMDALISDTTGELEKQLVNLLTTNHTYFWREPEHFEYFKREVLPYLKEKEKNTKDLRIWCAASSTGEEPYTLAMLVHDFFALDKDKWDTTILATDISTNVLRRAIDGRYTGEQVEPLPDYWKRRYFKPLPASDVWEITPEIKNNVLFRKFNLMDEFPFKHKMHVIFVRNVMIYFDEPTRMKLLRKLYDLLEPGGYLFIGKTETMDRGAIPFEMIEPSLYRKPEK